MQIHLSPRHLRLTAAIHRHCAEKISHLEALTDQIVAVHLVLTQDDAAKPSQRFGVKAHVAIPGPDAHAEESAGELYAALDLVMAKLARQLRKRKTRLKDKRRSKAQKAERSRQTGAG
jgi:putative sigma-54 modulation protein